jgi:hypothetical protein
VIGSSCWDGFNELLAVFSILLVAAGFGLLRGKGQLGGHCPWPTTRSVRPLHTGPGGVFACVQSLAVCAVVFCRPSAVPIAERSQGTRGGYSDLSRTGFRRSVPIPYGRWRFRQRHRDALSRRVSRGCLEPPRLCDLIFYTASPPLSGLLFQPTTRMTSAATSGGDAAPPALTQKSSTRAASRARRVPLLGLGANATRSPCFHGGGRNAHEGRADRPAVGTPPLARSTLR